MADLKHTPTPIPGWRGYGATPDGTIWALTTNWRGYGQRALRQNLNRCFYPCVRLTMGDGTRKRLTVHRLIAETFLGPCPAGCDQIRHLDGDRSNNRVENLAWGTAKQNADDRSRHGRGSTPRTPEWSARIGAAVRAAAERRRATQKETAQ